MRLHGANYDTTDLPSIANGGTIGRDAEITNARHTVHHETQLDTEIEAADLHNHLNDEQKEIVSKVEEAVSSGTGICIFVDGPGGSGKTFIYNTLISFARAHRLPYVAVATTGIAATLLRSGQTAHSMFQIPVRGIADTFMCSVDSESEKASTLRAASLIIWDEATMASKAALDAVDMLLRDLMRVNRPFGGKPIILGGDFRQTLPVVRRASPAQTVEACIRRSNVWRHFTVAHLTRNMRTRNDQQAFADWLLSIGEGRMRQVVLPPEIRVTSDLVDTVFGQAIRNGESIARRAILTPKNVDSLAANESVLALLPGESRKYNSIDIAQRDDGEEDASFPQEFLNSIVLSGMPPHVLNLKIGAIVILLRNLDTHAGLCNGSRMIVRALHERFITAEVLTGEHAGSVVFIPKIPLTPSDSTLPFKLNRFQLPLRLGFSMTVNKSQGQTLDHVGIDLSKPVFTHGQLYVALSRVRSFDCLTVKLSEQEEITRMVRNIVFGEVLGDGH